MAITDNLVLTPCMVHTTYDTDKMTLRLVERPPNGAKLETFTYAGSATEAADGKYSVEMLNTRGNLRRRTLTRLTHYITVADLSSNMVPISASIYVVCDFPNWGYTAAQRTSLMNTFRGGQGTNDSILTDPDVRTFLEQGIVL